MTQTLHERNRLTGRRRYTRTRIEKEIKRKEFQTGERDTEEGGTKDMRDMQLIIRKFLTGQESDFSR